MLILGITLLAAGQPGPRGTAERLGQDESRSPGVSPFISGPPPSSDNAAGPSAASGAAPERLSADPPLISGPPALGNAPFRAVTAALTADAEPPTERPLATARVDARVRTSLLPFQSGVGRFGDASVRFFVRQPQATTLVTDETIHYQLTVRDGTRVARWTIGERFVDALPSPVVAGTPALTRVSEFHGGSSANWRTDAVTWESVVRRGVYDGIDLTLRVTGDSVEKVFALAPGADPTRIRIAVEGIDALTLQDDGVLDLSSPAGTAHLSAPLAWQEVDDTRSPVGVTYVHDATTYGFRVDAYDASKPLFIDPAFYSTYVGGDGNDELNAIAVGPDGNVYVTGCTVRDPSSAAVDFYPTTPGAYDQTHNGDRDIVVSRFTPDLTSLLASTYVGGAGQECGRKIGFDAAGNVFVGGETQSSDFPTLASSFDRARGGFPDMGANLDGFVIKLDATLGSLVGATYIGGHQRTTLTALVVNQSDGSVFVAGSDGFSVKTSWTPDGKTLPANGYLAEPRVANGYAYIARLDSPLSNMTALTFLYGTSTECVMEGGSMYCPRMSPQAYAFADLGVSSGSVYAVGRTEDWTFPTTAGSFDPVYSISASKATQWNDLADAVVVRFDLGLTMLQASTFLGGKGEDEATSLALDSRGNVFVGGHTHGDNAASTGLPRSDYFPTTDGAYDTTYSGGWDQFVSRLGPDLSSLQASTVIGSTPFGFTPSLDSFVDDLTVDPGTGDVFLTGETRGASPTTVRAWQDDPTATTMGGSVSNVWVGRLDWPLASLRAGTLLGGDKWEASYGIAVDGSRNVFVTGATDSDNYPTSPGAFDPTFYGSTMDAFVSRLPPTLSQPGIHVTVRGPGNIAPGQRGTFTVRYVNGLEQAATNVVIAVDLPAGLELADTTGGGIFYAPARDCAGQVMWRFASLAADEAGTVTFTVEVPWGMPGADMTISVRGAAANETTPYFDVAPYIAYTPPASATTQDLDAAGVAAQLGAFPSARSLLDYARSIGYDFYDTGALDTHPDGRILLRLFLFAPDDGLPVVLVGSSTGPTSNDSAAVSTR